MPAHVLILATLLGCGSEEVPRSASVAVGHPKPTEQTPQATSPDIILMYVDTLRADHLSLYGYERRTSPRIDEWAATGAVYSRAYSQSGWTLASTASLLTGLYPHQHRVVRDSKQPDRFGCLVPQTQTLPEQLAAAGYRSAAFINNTFLAPEFGLQQGFDLYDYEGATNLKHRTATETVSDALRWWDANASHPRFAVVHMMEPHLNYEPAEDIRGTFASPIPPERLRPVIGKPDPFVAMQFNEFTPTADEKLWTVARYDEEVLTVDRAVGQLLDGLEQRGTLQETIVVLTSDHGEEFWEHDRFEHGHALWSPLTHVPLVITGPNITARRVDTVVEHVDLFQTILATASATRPPESEGQNLFALPESTEPRTALMENCLYGEPCVSLVTAQHRLMLNPLRGYAQVHPILSNGRDGPQIQGPQQNTLGQPLIQLVRQKRGTLDPVIAVGGGPRVPSFETFELLSQLGYVDRPDQPATEQPSQHADPTPCGTAAAPISPTPAPRAPAKEPSPTGKN